MNTTAPFPSLISERLSLRQPVREDAAALFALRNDPRVVMYTGIARYERADQAEAYLLRVRASFEGGQDVVWAIDRKTARGEMIGLISLWDRQPEGSMYIGYELLPAWQGQGYMAETARRVLDCAFSQLRLPAVLADPRADNAASFALLEKLGFSLCETRRSGPGEPLHRLYALRPGEAI